MKQQFNILLATDYSQEVMNAERYAVQFAKETNSILTIVHVYEIPFNTPAKPLEYVKTAEDIRYYELKKLEQHCNNLFHSLKIDLDEVKCECIVREGTVGKQILKQARESDIDFIVIGTNGESGFQKFLLGSHTWEVIKKSGIPVFALPKDVLYTGVKNIVFATEYREGELPGIKFLIQLAEQFDAQLTILHITNYVLSEELEKIIFTNFKDELKNKMPYEKLSLRVVHSEDIITGLNDFCLKTKADWLVMSPGKPFFLEKIFNSAKSVTKKMSIDPHIPLLMVPDFYYPEKVNFLNNESEVLNSK